jgi:alanine racemase
MFGPRAYIHLDRLAENYRCIKEHLGGQRLMAVVKANGYGHGAVKCAETLEKAGCDFFAVFTVGEGLELRKSGIRSEILIFSRMEAELFPIVMKQDLIWNLAWPEDLELLLRYYEDTGSGPRFHLKVDTGMTRLGIPIDKVESVVKQLKRHPELRCEGIYSHLATADEGDLSYAEFQLRQFASVLEIAKHEEYPFQWIHFSNSGAVLNLDQSPFNLVRVGMLLYGAFPSDEVPMDLPVNPVMEFRAPVVTVREVGAGTHVSYGGVFSTEKETTIGVIQCGFADGFPRAWYERGYVLWKGNRYRIAGRICMDQFMVDFEGQVPPIGDEVLLFGSGSEGSLTAETIAQTIKTTTYVIFTGIHGRTQRIYLED